jgi:hypothetical protein
LYIDRAITPILHPRDDELREVFRTSPQLFADSKFEKARPAVAQWVVQERLRAAETAYWQSARTRVHLVLLPRPLRPAASAPAASVPVPAPALAPALASVGPS